MEREVRTVLLVDGSASLLLYHGMLLKRLAYKVAAAVQNGEEALRAMNQAVPSLVLTETALAGMSGTELLKRIRNSPALRSVPVVILTSQSNAALKAECERLGCSGFLSKPVEPDVLYRRLQEVSETVPRQNIRIAVSLKAFVGPLDTAAGSRHMESVTELSEGGFFIQTNDPRPKDDRLQVRMVLPNRELSATAVVLYSFAPKAGSFKVPGMGVKFTELSDTDRNTIRNFIKEKLIGDIAPQIV